jgi:hypothetical protein
VSPSLSIGTSFIDWAQQSDFHLKTEREFSLRKLVHLKKNKNKTMYNIQEHDNFINTSSSQIFRSY